MRLRAIRILTERFLCLVLGGLTVRQVIEGNAKVDPRNQQIRFDSQRASERVNRVLSFVLFEERYAKIVLAISGFTVFKCGLIICGGGRRGRRRRRFNWPDAANCASAYTGEENQKGGEPSHISARMIQPAEIILARHVATHRLG